MWGLEAVEDLAASEVASNTLDAAASGSLVLDVAIGVVQVTLAVVAQVPFGRFDRVVLTPIQAAAKDGAVLSSVGLHLESFGVV